MEVYIEDVFLDNFIIDSIILLLTAKLLKNKYKNILIIVSSFIGVFFNIFLIIFNLSNFYLFIYKIILSLFMVFVAFGSKKFFANYITFLFITFLIGGLCYAISMTFGSVQIVDGGVYYDMSIPVWLVVLSVAVVCYFVFHLISFLKNNVVADNFVYTVEILVENKTYKFNAYLDSGNMLTDNGKPVMFISLKAFQKLFGLNLIDILNHNFEKLSNPHFKIVEGVGNKSKILLFNFEKIKIIKNKIEKNIENALFGVSYVNLEKKLNCSVLLNSQILEVCCE